MLDLRDELGLRRAVETGTYTGGTTRKVAPWFETVATIELSDRFYRESSAGLADLPNVRCIHRRSPEALRELHDPAIPTIYWLDAHWSGGDTAGADNPCPVLEELEALKGGHPDDCVLIDDAREFATATAGEGYPTLVELLDALRAALPGHHATSIHDLVVAVPQRAKGLVDSWGKSGYGEVYAAAEPVRLRGHEPDQPTVVGRVVQRLTGR